MWWCTTQKRAMTANETTNAKISQKFASRNSPNEERPMWAAASTRGRISSVIAIATVASEKFTSRSSPRSVLIAAMPSFCRTGQSSRPSSRARRTADVRSETPSFS